MLVCIPGTLPAAVLYVIQTGSLTVACTLLHKDTRIFSSHVLYSLSVCICVCVCLSLSLSRCVCVCVMHGVQYVQYDCSSKQTRTTHYGVGHGDEMCAFILFYYPVRGVAARCCVGTCASENICAPGYIATTIRLVRVVLSTSHVAACVRTLTHELLSSCLFVARCALCVWAPRSLPAYVAAPLFRRIHTIIPASIISVV